MNAMRSLRLSAFLAAAGLGCAQASGQWWWPPTGGLQVSPPCLDTSTQVSLTVSGDWPNNCIPNFSSASVNGNEVDVQTVRDPPPGICLSVITAWERTSTVGPLAVGAYSVFVTHRVAGQIVHPRTMVGSFVVVASCSSACYANCDGSTSAPILNVSDFVWRPCDYTIARYRCTR